MVAAAGAWAGLGFVGGRERAQTRDLNWTRMQRPLHPMRSKARIKTCVWNAAPAWNRWPANAN